MAAYCEGKLINGAYCALMEGHSGVHQNTSGHNNVYLCRWRETHPQISVNRRAYNAMLALQAEGKIVANLDDAGIDRLMQAIFGKGVTVNHSNIDHSMMIAGDTVD